jgi:hypothetical protein
MATKITFKFDSTKTMASGELETVLGVECKDGKKPLKDEEVELFVAGKSVEKKKTDASGKISFVVKCPTGTTTLAGELKSSPGNGSASWTLNIPVPQTTTGNQQLPKTPAVDLKDPVEIQVLRSALPGPGKFRLFARVLNPKGKGLSSKHVGFVFRGTLVELKTNAAGLCQFPQGDESIEITPGNEEKVTAFVSGISQLTVTNVCRRRDRTPDEIAKAQANNRRARIFLGAGGIVFAVWLLMAIIVTSIAGLGEPLLSDVHDVTAQEKFVGTIPGIAVMDKSLPNEGYWQKPLLSITLFLILTWGMISILYGIIALREEVAEAWRAGMEALVDKHYVRAQDPLFERFAAWSGHLTRAKVQPVNLAPPATPTGTPVPRGRFWDYFRSDLASDFIVEILPRIFRAIVGGR